jgi:hypothetical protein
MTRHSLLAEFTELTPVIGRFNGCRYRTKLPPGTPGGDKCEDVGGWGVGGWGGTQNGCFSMFKGLVYKRYGKSQREKSLSHRREVIVGPPAALRYN